MDQASDEPRRRLWLLWVALAVVAFAIGLVLVCEDRGPATGTRHPAVGKELTRLELQPLTGTDRPVSLADLSGKVVLLNFWGTWCGPCAEEFPHLDKIWKKHRERADFRLLAVSCGPSVKTEDPETLHRETEQFLEDLRCEMPTYLDQKGFTREGLDAVGGMKGYPTTLILDRKTVVRAMWDGYRPGAEHDMASTIESLLAETD